MRLLSKPVGPRFVQPGILPGEKQMFLKEQTIKLRNFKQFFSLLKLQITFINNVAEVVLYLDIR